MRFSPHGALNLVAWGVIGGLIAGAVVVATVYGFLGLFILGTATTLVCVLAELNDDVPVAGVAVFRARMQAGGSPEQRAAMKDEQRQFLSPLRFYRRCGLALAAIGAAGSAWQIWG